MSAGFDDGDLDLEAAEYVLGTLDARERDAFTARLKDDERTRRAVAAWEARLAGLGWHCEAMPPSPRVWERIERSISSAGAKMHTFKVIPGGGSGPGAESATLRKSRDRWRLGALASGLIAAALAIFIGNRLAQAPATIEPPTATYVAAVNRGGDKPALIVTVDLATGRVLVRPVAATAPAGHSLELWYIGTDKTPRSMGLVAADKADLRLPAGEAPDAGTFAVSVEPPGGSKTGSPTGPVVYAGQLVKQ